MAPDETQNGRDLTKIIHLTPPVLEVREMLQKEVKCGVEGHANDDQQG